MIYLVDVSWDYFLIQVDYYKCVLKDVVTAHSRRVYRLTNAFQAVQVTHWLVV